MSTLARLRDLVADSILGLMAATSRSLAVIAACALGVGGLVASRGVSETAAFQISNQIDLPSLDEVRISTDAGTDGTQSALGSDQEAMILRLAGVRHAGVSARFTLPGSVARIGVDLAASPVQVVATTRNYLRTVGATIDTEAALWPDRSGATHVVYVGRRLATQLNIAVAEPGVRLSVYERPYDVVGILASGGRDEQLERSVVVSIDDRSIPLEQFGRPEMLVVTKPGAAREVGSAAPYVLSPVNPFRFKATKPPSLKDLRRGVAEDTSRLLLAVSIVLMLVATVGIASAMHLNVVNRTAEMGLRRALGMRRWELAFGRLIEGVALGTIGGLLGSATGVVGVVAISAFNGWTPTLGATLVPFGVALGAAVGTVAAIVPALSSTRISPALALRR